MTRSSLWKALRQVAVPVIGTGVAFAFLEAGAFADLGVGTLQRMVAAPGLRAAALGAGVTALLLTPVLVWQHRRSRNGAA
ncbi:MAG: hypothetical protein OEW24_09085 [Chloroflexota bacterium]|nr:hypothetical protein [Chloroflexota bacterium]